MRSHVENEEERCSPKTALIPYYSYEILSTLIACIILGAVYYFWHHFSIWISVVVVVLLCIQVVYAISYPLIKWHKTLYVSDDNGLFVSRRWLFYKNHVVKYDRIQTIQIKQGVLLRWLGLYKLRIHTAGDYIEFPLLSQSEVMRIEQYCARKLEGANYDI